MQVFIAGAIFSPETSRIRQTTDGNYAGKYSDGFQRRRQTVQTSPDVAASHTRRTLADDVVNDDDNDVIDEAAAAAADAADGQR